MTRRTAIVTGSTSGIGRDIARRLHADGLNLVITGRDIRRGEQVRADLGDHAIFVATDLTWPHGTDALADTAMNRFGRVDVLVNSATMDYAGDLQDVPIEDIRKLFEVNTLAAMSLTQQIAKRMRHGGAIINVGSQLIPTEARRTSVHDATQGAVRAFTSAAAVELAPLNIRVNAVAPGVTRTLHYEAWLQEQQDPTQSERDLVSAIPLGRLATCADVSAAVSFLASQEAAYITGACIPVNGGFTAR